VFPVLNFQKTNIILAFTYFPDMQETTTDRFVCHNMTIYLLFWHLQITTPTAAKVIGVYKRHVLDVVRNACRYRNGREDIMQTIFVPANVKHKAVECCVKQ